MSDHQDGPPSSIHIAEPPPGIGTGFLSGYWSSGRSLPTLQGFEVSVYYFQQGVRTVTALVGSSVITVLTIAVSLFLLAGFLLILQNVGKLLSEAGSTLYVTAYIADGSDATEVTNFVRQLQSNSRISAAEYVSKQQALEIFREDLGSRSGFLAGLEENNPLPASVDIVLQPDKSGSDGVNALIEGLRAQAVVEELVYGSEWVERMQRIVKIFRLFGMVSLLIALGIILFLISNTIKLVIYARRDEIGIMQLVGASDSFIKIPFVLGGLIQGLIGSVIGIALLKLGFMLLSYEIRSSTVFGVAMPELVFLNIWAVLAIVLIGVVVGAVGSLFALGKFMNV